MARGGADLKINLSSAAPLRGTKRWRVLERAETIHMATVSGDDPIYVTALWYVVRDRTIYIPLDQANRHVKNIESGGRLSAEVDMGEGFSDVHGVNLEGSATVVEDPELIEELEDLVLDKYFYEGHPYLEEYIQFGLYNRRRWYEIVPTRMYGWDLREATLLAAPERRVLPESFFEATNGA